MAEHHKAFDLAVASVIVVNTGLLAWAWLDPAREEIIDHIETVCLAFFVVELALRIRGHGLRFFRTGWGVADTLIIGLSLLPLLGVDVSLLRVARLARVFHLGRHITHLRLLRLIPMTRRSV